MGRFVKLCVPLVVFAFLIAVSSCGNKNVEEPVSESSNLEYLEQDQLKEVCALMTGCLGLGFIDAANRVEEYFGISFDLEKYSDLSYYSEEDGYCEYIFDEKVTFAGVDFDQVRFFSRIDNGICFHISFVNETEPLFSFVYNKKDYLCKNSLFNK